MSIGSGGLRNGKAAAATKTDMGMQPTTGRAWRYHPGVIWGPFLLAVALGLIVSAGLYFAYLWPQDAPDDDE
jgi:hypothetical protein